MKIKIFAAADRFKVEGAKIIMEFKHEKTGW
jgi:hypothetical protein